jgi:hypothetical protein
LEKFAAHCISSDSGRRLNSAVSSVIDDPSHLLRMSIASQVAIIYNSALE